MSRTSKTHARSTYISRTLLMVIDRAFIYLFLRAIVLVLIINYSSLKRGLSVKRAQCNGGSSQFLHNLVLFKLYLPAFGAFSF